jgi:hypothetical protein
LRSLGGRGVGRLNVDRDRLLPMVRDTSADPNDKPEGAVPVRPGARDNGELGDLLVSSGWMN